MASCTSVHNTTSFARVHHDRPIHRTSTTSLCHFPATCVAPQWCIPPPEEILCRIRGYSFELPDYSVMSVAPQWCIPPPEEILCRIRGYSFTTRLLSNECGTTVVIPSSPCLTSTQKKGKCGSCLSKDIGLVSARRRAHMRKRVRMPHVFLCVRQHLIQCDLA